MTRSDEDNIQRLTLVDSIDEVNKKFYEEYPYPWAPLKFESVLDPDFEVVMLNQTLGDWQHKMIPPNAQIWIAGCGTNQAVYTALKFPQATVLGSDLSTVSLDRSASIAKELGIVNLSHQAESIHQTHYKERFDYIICTGVIHHTANPLDTLRTLSTALKPEGVLELMVYNRFHRIETTALQKAVQILSEAKAPHSFASELDIAKMILKQASLKHPLAIYLENDEDALDDSLLADLFIQPVEHSYTVESLAEMATLCNLQLLLPSLNGHNKTNRAISWNMEFDNLELQRLYQTLPDSARWQVANLVLLEKSPMLWFYFQRSDNRKPRKTEIQVCNELLDKKIIKNSTFQRVYMLGENGQYHVSPQLLPFPRGRLKGIMGDIYEQVDGETPLREILRALNIQSAFPKLNKIRLQLTTSAFPYVKVCGDTNLS
jgi:2-polyprenyl-3-methyl-5-hydroxy-6-metoxy-1,4-benzoquinol methylase